MLPILPLTVLPGQLAICRLAPEAALPTWALRGFFSITHTPDELSIVCVEANIPPEVPREGGWRGLRVTGQLDFALTGILAALAAPLAEAGVSIFAISTYHTDYVLVKQEQLPIAVEALRQAGHSVAGDLSALG